MLINAVDQRDVMIEVKRCSGARRYLRSVIVVPKGSAWY